MAKTVADIMLPLSEYAVVDEGATIVDALLVLRESQAKVPPGRQPHRAILVRGREGRIVGKLHYFAFLRALLPERKARAARDLADDPAPGDDFRDTSKRMLDLLTGEVLDVRERARSVTVGDVCTPVTVSIHERAPLSDAIPMFLAHRTLSLLVTRDEETVGLLRLSDFCDELAREITEETP